MIKFIKKVKHPLLIVMFAMIIGGVYSLQAGTIKTQKDKNAKGEVDQNILQARTYSGVFDLQKNTVSNIDFYTTNYGIFGFDIARQRGGGFWPRGSQNQYIFAGGFWFGARKYRARANDTVSYVSITYNPNSGDGWFVPGRINYGGPGSKDQADEDNVNNDEKLKYRTYFSSDFNPGSGAPIQSEHNFNWPIWDSSVRIEDTLKTNRYFGKFIPQVELRNTTQFKKGPAFISGEDIFSTYKDTDLSFYEGGVASRRERGYPLRLQVDQMIYSWGFGDYRDFIFIKYEITNYSADTLWQCWLAPVMDVDIARAISSGFGAGNDKAKFYDCDTTLNLAVQWTNTDRGEFGYGFGYLGFDFLESPAVQKYFDTTRNEIRDKDGNLIRVDTILTQIPYDPIKHKGMDLPNFVRKDSTFYHNSSQLGLNTFRNWSIEVDPKEDEERYQFISSKIKDGDTGPGDKRFMMATGEFNLRPGDTARVVVGMILANTGLGGEADGTCDDMSELVRKDKFAQAVYDNNFRAPTPPDRAVITKITPLNNGVTIEWDNTSELSVDIDERGLDFMGYTIYRARRANLDGYSPDIEQGSNEYPLGRGPMGWKLVSAYAMRPPFVKTEFRAGLDQTNLSMPLIDDFEILGPYTDESGKIIDSMAVRVMRRGAGIGGFSDARGGIAFVDTSAFSAPWGQDWWRMLKEDSRIEIANDGTIIANYGGNRSSLVYSTSPARRHFIFDSVFVGVARLNRGILKFNPLFYEKKVVNRSQSYIDTLTKYFPDWVVGLKKRVWDPKLKDSVDVRYTTDSIYIKGTVRRGDINGSPSLLVEAWVPRALNNIMNDSAHVVEVKDSLLTYIKSSQVKMDYPDYETRKNTRENVIAPYTKWRTNNRTLTDIGDDNSDGWINPDADPTITEKLINNVEYHYKVIAFDEGDYTQPTEGKFNIGTPGLSNFATALPTAAPTDNLPELKVIYVDSSRIGGLSNFKFFAVNNDRVQQRFAGDTLELNLNPFWSQISLTMGGTVPGKLGLYRTLALLKSRKTNDTLFYGLLSYENQPCNISFYNLFTENAASYVLSDTVIVDSIGGNNIDFGTPNARGILTRSGKFFSGDFSYAGYCYTNSWTQNAYGMLGFGFDFTIQQWAGRLRPDAVEFAQGVTASTNTAPIAEVADRITSGNLNVVMVTQPVSFNYSTYNIVYGSFNNGPAVYEVEFLQGGTENVELSYNKATVKKTFTVPYLNMKVKNVIEYLRPVAGGTDSVAVKYPIEVTHMTIPSVAGIRKSTRFDNVPDYKNLYPINYFPDPTNLPQIGKSTDEFIGKFNMYSYGYVAFDANHTRATTNRLRLINQVARPISGLGSGPDDASFTGLQGRYYMSGVSTDGKDTIDFVNVFNGGGLLFAFDFANKGQISNRESIGFVWPRKENYDLANAKDFKVGDKVYLKTYGGALGLPLPGTQILAVVSPKAEGEGYLTNELMDKIQIAPNPYYITHQAVKSPYDSKIFFAKLPAKATIEIFTAAGDLVTTLNHDEYNNDGELDRHAVQVWDLLSKNRQRIQSQSLIAVITAPNGAKTVKNFSVVVGGFRLIEQ
jgi:hypothetical protein